MEISKRPNEYNTYSVILSYGELKAIKELIEKHSAGVIDDEMLKAINWYFDNQLPEPGETPEQFKQKKELAKSEVEQEADELLPEPEESEEIEEPVKEEI